jgi:SAM-dependent methyltransferase
MHKTAMKNGEDFFSTYSKFFTGSNVTVVDIGAQDVNGSLKEVCPKSLKYIGVDFQDAKGVDIVLTDPYKLPFDDASIDIVVSSSCFEHSEMFWLSYLEILRILKPTGLFYLNAPSDGGVHKYPVDCWRFYPDSGQALVTWSKRNGLDPILLECYTQVGGGWQDYVAIFLKDQQHQNLFTDRILNHKKDFENGMLSGQDVVLNAVGTTQNVRKLRRRSLKGILRKLFLIDLVSSIFKPPQRQQ